jgi:hypothetical protein
MLTFLFNNLRKCNFKFNFSLLDPKKKENYEKYGNPSGPDAKFWEDKYPDLVVNPGKSVKNNF